MWLEYRTGASELKTLTHTQTAKSVKILHRKHWTTHTQSLCKMWSLSLSSGEVIGRLAAASLRSQFHQKWGRGKCRSKSSFLKLHLSVLHRNRHIKSQYDIKCICFLIHEVKSSYPNLCQCTLIFCICATETMMILWAVSYFEEVAGV